jgi:hypothetical protein
VAAPSEDEGRILGTEDVPWYDQRKRMLGTLCKDKHEWGTTGQSLGGIRKNGKYSECLQCQRERMADERKKHTAASEDEDATA